MAHTIYVIYIQHYKHVGHLVETRFTPFHSCHLAITNKAPSSQICRGVDRLCVYLCNSLCVYLCNSLYVYLCNSLCVYICVTHQVAFMSQHHDLASFDEGTCLVVNTLPGTVSCQPIHTTLVSRRRPKSLRLAKTRQMLQQVKSWLPQSVHSSNIAASLGIEHNLLYHYQQLQHF